ncbi:NAD(P)-dependent oxidoreductase [Sphingomonas sp. GlSt437]|uniref:precorrin-2 dehydrogenase/sirohydrochlorin ferrochelatase family protein n=1 Tax=Sphingomonas sp. GlSt437 TaxID=3389970 RepID=UPI003A892957
MAEGIGLHSLPLFMRLAERPVILLGDGEAAAAKRRLLERAGAVIVGEDAEARLAIVAIEDEGEALAAIERLRARRVLVNAVDRPDHCDFTLPAIIDRSPVIVAIGTGGASAGLAAALRQRLEALLPAGLGKLANDLNAARARLRDRWPDGGDRRRALADAMAPAGALDPLGSAPDVQSWLASGGKSAINAVHRVILTSSDPDDLTLRQARLLAQADRVYHAEDVPRAILDRARADAARLPLAGDVPEALPGVTCVVEMG